MNPNEKLVVSCKCGTKRNRAPCSLPRIPFGRLPRIFTPNLYPESFSGAFRAPFGRLPHSRRFVFTCPDFLVGVRGLPPLPVIKPNQTRRAIQ